MADSTIDNLPTADSLTGAENVVLSQDGITKKAPVSAIGVPPLYAKSDLPAASDNAGRIAVITGGASGKPLVVSDGNVWLYADGVTVV